MTRADEESEGGAQREWQGLATLVRNSIKDNEPDLVRAQRRARFVTACAAQARVLPTLGHLWWSTWWAWGTATAFVVGAVLLVVFSGFGVAPTLSYRVTGAEADGGYLQLAETAAPAEVSFSDGSHIHAQPPTRMRIAGVGARGAHLVLERGRLDVDVKHRPRAGWTIEAGPYAVAITGTAFSVRWENDELSVVMARGSVTVRGPSAPAGVAVLGGQELTARPRDHLLSVVDRTSVPPVVKTSTTASPSVDTDVDGPGPASAPEEPASLSPRVATSRAWPRRIAAGEYALVLREAEDRGLNAVLAGGSVADIAALADAARYLHRRDIARRALLVERSRFPRSQEARAAAFLLARIIEEDGDQTAAVGGYGRYLQESPRGPFAQEALGRQVALLWKRGERATALPLAQTYLRRFRRGPYAPIAHDIVDGS